MRHGSMRELLLASLLTSASAGGSTTCVACGLVVTLVLERRQLCSVEDANCHAAAMELKKLAPDEVCKLLGICPHNSSCTLWPDSEWPPASLPPQPPHDPPNLRRRLADGGDALQRLARALAGVFQTRSSKQQEGFLAMSETVYDVLGIGNTQMGLEAAAQTAVSSGLPKTHPCAPLNVSCIIDRFANQHLPIFDRDVDAFSSQEHRGLRGSHWRGADCDDGDPAVYPGRRTPPSNDSSVDHDCNGIAGSNASNGVPYEELLCAGTERRGLIHIGDSATAHFHLPPSWLTAQGWSGLNNGRADAIDELDWPACAWGTGFKNASDCPPTANASLAALPSLAARLRLRNRCNHRDFQNIGVNGARVTGILPSIASAARSAALDHPALVVFSLIGNDVCNGHADTIAHMTTPAEFRNKTLGALAALDAKMPRGSFVLLVGLVDGRVLYESLHAHTHPTGTTYEDVYEYLTCNGANPCNGWLSSNATLRNLTSARASDLSAVHESIAATSTYANISLGYYRPDLRALVSNYTSQTGRDPKDLFEPSDGFHPSQLANALLAEQLWLHLEANYPHALGQTNPHNAEIERLFGDQGGF